MVTIAVDAMGGDHAPKAEVEGAIRAARTLGVKVILVGREEILRDILAGIIALRPHLGADSFIASWEKVLAFRGEQVHIEEADGSFTVASFRRNSSPSNWRRHGPLCWRPRRGICSRGESACT